MSDIVLASAGALRERLRNDTRPEHEALEAALDLMRPDLDLAAYGALLERFHAFHLAFDDWMNERAAAGWPAAGFYCDGRRKSGWLSEDLAALGIGPHAGIDRALRARLPALLPSPQHAWGAVYVIEGSTLGGTVLSKHFIDTLGIAPGTGLRFFSGYGADTGRRWKLVLERLHDCETQGAPAHAVIDGARHLFALLKRHLTAHGAHGDMDHD